MKVGASTACFYPLETEKALLELAQAGIKNAEIFFNADCELSGSIFNEIKNIVYNNQMTILSVHPFTSAVETMSLFGDYPRRFDAMMDTYKNYFEVMNILGANVFVLHGALKSAVVEDEVYFERYLKLFEEGKRFGVTVAQENVSYCKSGSREFISLMEKSLGENCKFVLDVKQAIRSGITAFDLLEDLGGSIVHCHLSDSNEKTDCIPVGKGKFDFKGFVKKLKEINYSGNIILELYKDGYENVREIKESISFMEKVFQEVSI